MLRNVAMRLRAVSTRHGSAISSQRTKRPRHRRRACKWSRRSTYRSRSYPWMRAAAGATKDRAVQARGDAPSTEVLPTGADATEGATVQVDRGDALKALMEKLDAQLQTQEGGESGVLDRAEPLTGLKSEDEEIIVTSE